jgi:hypothetical protein
LSLKMTSWSMTMMRRLQWMAYPKSHSLTSGQFRRFSGALYAAVSLRLPPYAR